ncbi:secretion system protein [Izhakiella australiensis]|uniref:Secretion system protein n=1 Tax=Izhakiella australiensis TaxID=1926881 RepID=A0A1S8YSM4_9GAMM|nr:type II secretion system F family protein [Izhakiella australiensis]OON42171.1 secretion system protein [Izhakiella australiensis]
MEYFFWVVFLSGMGMCIILLRNNQRWSKKRKIIETAEEEYAKNTSGILNYKTIIIENSSLLRFLNHIENSLTMKLRIGLGSGALLLACKLLGLYSIGMKGLAMCVLMILVAVIVLPAMVMKPIIITKTKQLLDALPYFIDLIGVCIQSGMTVESAIKFIAQHADELDRNLATLMHYLIKRAEVSGLEEGLLDLYHAMDMTEMRMFCSTLQQSVHYGTSLYENLMELSKDIRELQLLDSEEKIGNLSAKMSVPLILFIMFPLTILIAAPGILRILKHALF